MQVPPERDVCEFGEKKFDIISTRKWCTCSVLTPALFLFCRMAAVSGSIMMAKSRMESGQLSLVHF